METLKPKFLRDNLNCSDIVKGENMGDWQDSPIKHNTRLGLPSYVGKPPATSKRFAYMKGRSLYESASNEPSNEATMSSREELPNIHGRNGSTSLINDDIPGTKRINKYKPRPNYNQMDYSDVVAKQKFPGSKLKVADQTP